MVPGNSPETHGMHAPGPEPGGQKEGQDKREAAVHGELELTDDPVSKQYPSKCVQRFLAHRDSSLNRVSQLSDTAGQMLTAGSLDQITT